MSAMKEVLQECSCYSLAFQMYSEYIIFKFVPLQDWIDTFAQFILRSKSESSY